MCQARECGRAESGSEALRMYIKIDASTKYDLPVHVPTLREIDRNDDNIIAESIIMRETLLSYYENKNITKE